MFNINVVFLDVGQIADHNMRSNLGNLNVMKENQKSCKRPKKIPTAISSNGRITQDGGFSLTFLTV